MSNNPFGGGNNPFAGPRSSWSSDSNGNENSLFIQGPKAPAPGSSDALKSKLVIPSSLRQMLGNKITTLPYPCSVCTCIEFNDFRGTDVCLCSHQRHHHYPGAHKSKGGSGVSGSVDQKNDQDPNNPFSLNNKMNMMNLNAAYELDQQRRDEERALQEQDAQQQQHREDILRRQQLAMERKQNQDKDQINNLPNESINLPGINTVNMRPDLNPALNLNAMAAMLAAQGGLNRMPVNFGQGANSQQSGLGQSEGGLSLALPSAAKDEVNEEKTADKKKSLGTKNDLMKELHLTDAEIVQALMSTVPKLTVAKRAIGLIGRMAHGLDKEDKERIQKAESIGDLQSVIHRLHLNNASRTEARELKQLLQDLSSSLHDDRQATKQIIAILDHFNQSPTFTEHKKNDVVDLFRQNAQQIAQQLELKTSAHKPKLENHHNVEHKEAKEEKSHDHDLLLNVHSRRGHH